MKFVIAGILSLAISVSCFSQENTTSKKSSFIKGMYFQWGYNTEVYTKSNLHFKLKNGSDFKVKSVKAKDFPGLDAIWEEPLEISIPQFNFRIGFYLNEAKTRSIEINYDHSKYIVNDFQTAKVTGTIEGQQVDKDMVLDPATFLHFEHSDGANWLHFMWVQQYFFKKPEAKYAKMSLLWKAGAGVNIPRTDFTWKGSRFNNNFHIAGYNFGVEGAGRYYFSKKFFFELAAKTGYVRYVNALTNTEELKGNRASHGVGYLEGIATIGLDVMFKQKK